MRTINIDFSANDSAKKESSPLLFQILSVLSKGLKGLDMEAFSMSSMVKNTSGVASNQSAITSIEPVVSEPAAVVPFKEHVGVTTTPLSEVVIQRDVILFIALIGTLASLKTLSIIGNFWKKNMLETDESIGTFLSNNKIS